MMESEQLLCSKPFCVGYSYRIGKASIQSGEGLPGG